MIDPMGLVITTIRRHPAVAAIVGHQVRGGVYGVERPDVSPPVEPPFVLIRELTSTRSPGGAGNGRLGLQGVLYVGICYGALGDSSHRETRRLWGAVSDAIHNQGPRQDAQGRVIFQSMQEGGSGPGPEPGTGWIRQDLPFNVIAAAQAVA